MDSTKSRTATGAVAEQRVKSGLDKKNQIPKAGTGSNPVLLMSSLLDASARLRAEAEQRRARRKRTIPIDASVKASDDEFEQFQRTTLSSASVSAKRSQSRPGNACMKGKWGKLVGQPLDPHNTAHSEERGAKEDPTLLASVRNPVNQIMWEAGVKWNGADTEEAANRKLKPASTTNTPAASSTMTTTAAVAPAVDDIVWDAEATEAAIINFAAPDDAIVWDEEDDGGALGPSGSSTSKTEVPEPKRLKLSDFQWDLVPDENDTKPAVGTGEAEKIVAKESSKGILGRNEQLSKGEWREKVIWDEAQINEEAIRAQQQRKVTYHVKDDAFALDEINRRKLLDQRLQQQLKLLQQQQQMQHRQDGENGKEDGKGNAQKQGDGKDKPSAPVNPALRGAIAPAPPQPKNIPGRGPPKKELLQRRYAQFGELLRMMGIVETGDGVPLPPPAAVAAAQAAAKTDGDVIEKSSEPSTMGWQSLVPLIRHSEPAQELEWFDPEFRYVDPVKSFRRPVAFHREKQTVRVVMDPNQFSTQQLAGSSASAAGIRVDGAGGVGTDSNLNELELAVSSRTWRKKDLSNKNGKIMLFEYAEQHPLFLNGTGMASQVINFYRQERGSGGVMPPKPEFGLFVGLNADEISPLLTRIDPGKVYRVLHNNMMNAPLVEHRPQSTDFLLIRHPKRAGMSASSSSGASGTTAPAVREIAMVRRIAKLFVCGQVEPQMEIFQPSELSATRTKFLNWLERYMQFQFATRLKRRDDMRIQFTTARDLFSLASDRMVERALSEVAEKDTVSGEMKKRYWVPIGAGLGTKTKAELRRDLEEKRRLCLTTLKPEDCCSWEQVQLGLAKLSQAGITRVARSEVAKVLEAYKMIRKLHVLREWSHDALVEWNRLGTATPFPHAETARQSAAVRYVVRELELTPWYLSTCFIWLHLRAESINNPFPANTVMRVTGLGDPSGRSEMVSFLPKYASDQKPGKASKLTDAAAQAQSAAAQAALAGGEGGLVTAAVVADDEDELLFDLGDGKKKQRKRTAVPIDDRPKYGGTENDLRIVKMEDLGDILVDLGVPPEEVAKISRWDRTWLIEKAASSSMGPYLLGGAIAKYARIPGNNNPGLDMATGGAAAGGVAAGGEEERGDAREDYAARKRLEETPQFMAHRERITKVYERMIATLSETYQQQQTASTSTALTPATTAQQQQKTGGADLDDEDLLDFAENLKESLLSQQQAEAEARQNAASVRQVKDASLQEALEEKNLLESFKKQVDAAADSKTTANNNLIAASTAPAAPAVVPRVGWTPFKVLKRTIIEVLPNGSERIRVEYYKNPEKVKEWEQAQRDKALSLARGRKFQYGEADEDDDYDAVRRGGPGGKGVGGRKSLGGSAGGVGKKAGGKRTKSPIPGSAAGGVSDKERQRAEEKERQTRETQKQHAEWYKQLVETYGKDFFKDYVENDPRLPSTMPRRGGGGKCSLCGLPGHNAQSPLCPLFQVGMHANDNVKVSEGGLKLNVNLHKLPSSSSSTPRTKKRAGEKSYDLALNALAPGPLAELSKKFVHVLDVVGQLPSAGPFLQPVDRKQWSNYYKVISTPMDLNKIRDKASNGKYKDRHKFYADMQLMYENSKQFNGPDSLYTHQAQEILGVASQTLIGFGDVLTELENGVSKMGSKRGKKPQGLATAAPVSFSTAAFASIPVEQPMLMMPEEGEEIEVVEEEEPFAMPSAAIEEGGEEEIIEEVEEEGQHSGEIML